MNPRIHRIGNSEYQDPSLMDNEMVDFSTEVSVFEIGGESFGPGRIVLTNQRIMYIPSSIDVDVFFFDYRSVALHAISARDDKKCVFIQLMSNEDVESDQDDDQNESNDNVIEIFPKIEDSVTPLFEHMNEMSALHPDTDSDDEGDYDEAYDSEDAGDGSVPE